jgi:hypothetical protein
MILLQIVNRARNEAQMHHTKTTAAGPTRDILSNAGQFMSNPPANLEFLIGSMAVPTVVLRHDLPDGSHHYDWMIAVDPEGSQPLKTFRLAERLDQLEPTHQLSAISIQDHRPDYLRYEGPVSGNRGMVKRVCSGRLHLDGNAEIVIEWHRLGDPDPFRTQRLQLLHDKKEAWRVICIANSPLNR